MNIVSSKQKAELKLLAAGGNMHAAQILECLDKGVVPPPEAIDWLIRWFRLGARGAA
jgi:cellulose synthase/poly-beta-1,6-N-acetylglucosamine synthase-like glycosyltransferase